MRLEIWVGFLATFDCAAMVGREKRSIRGDAIFGDWGNAWTRKNPSCYAVVTLIQFVLLRLRAVYRSYSILCFDHV